MYIVKNLKDYQLSHKQRIFAGFLKDNIDSYTCLERITNRMAIRKYFSPENDFQIYTTAIAEPAELISRAFVS